MINYLFGSIFLLIQSIKDIKTYEIDEKLCYIFSFFGVLYHIVLFLITINFNYLIFLNTSFILSLIFFYILWKIGMIGGGDFKIFLTLSLLVPVFDYNKNLFDMTNYFPIVLFFASIIMTFPYAIFYTLSKKPISFWIKKIFEINELRFFSGILILFYLENLLNLNYIFFIFLIFIIYKVLPKDTFLLKIIIISFFIVNIFINPTETVYNLIIIFFGMVILLYLKNFRKVLSKKINVEDSEGEISNWDYFLIDGKIEKVDPLKRVFYLNKGKPILLSKASGITKRDIVILKKHNIKEIDVKDKIPFIPSILIAYIFLYFFWKFW